MGLHRVLMLRTMSYVNSYVICADDERSRAHLITRGCVRASKIPCVVIEGPRVVRFTPERVA